MVSTTTADDMIVEDESRVKTVNHLDDFEVDSILSPTIQEISQSLQALHIRHVIQPYRCYPRCDPYENPGRCLVDVKTHFKNKYELLTVIAKEIQKLPSRPQRMEQERIRQQAIRDQLQALTLTELNTGNTAGAMGTSTSSAAISSSNKKKSGKKKK